MSFENILREIEEINAKVKENPELCHLCGKNKSCEGLSYCFNCGPPKLVRSDFLVSTLEDIYEQNNLLSSHPQTSSCFPLNTSDGFVDFTDNYSSSYDEPTPEQVEEFVQNIRRWKNVQKILYE